MAAESEALLDKGVYTPFDFPGALITSAFDINNRGQITGYYFDAERKAHGYVRDRNGDYTTIDVPGASQTFPFGINNRGHVVGAYFDANQVRRGFLFENSEFTKIDHPLAASDTILGDLDDLGRIVGLYPARRDPGSRCGHLFPHVTVDGRSWNGEVSMASATTAGHRSRIFVVAALLL